MQILLFGLEYYGVLTHIGGTSTVAVSCSLVFHFPTVCTHTRTAVLCAQAHLNGNLALAQAALTHLNLLYTQ